MASEAPPSYAQATGSSTSSHPQASNEIPPHRRRSMEDESRPLPKGWVRQFDPKSSHQFFVDTNAKPPRSIWHHPHDDEKYLSTLSAEERERIEEMDAHPTRADILPMSSDEDLHASHGKAARETTGIAAGAAGAAPAPSPATQSKGIKKFGRSLKDKMTGTTHEQRETERRDRELQEQQEYETHQRIRAAMARAMETGQPQYIGKDRNGKDVYIEPPSYEPYGAPGAPGGYYGPGGYGYNPYQSGPYRQTANAVYVRPDYPYSRPYGGGYGGGYGLPLFGGLLGGALLGGLLF